MSASRRGLRCAAALAGAAARAAPRSAPAMALLCGAGAGARCLAAATVAARATSTPLRRGFAADAGSAAAPAQQPPRRAEPWDADGAFLPVSEAVEGRPVFVPHAPYVPRAATPVAQGIRAWTRVPVWCLEGGPAPSGGTVTLHGDVFDVPIRPDIVHRVVRWQLAKRRQGTHSTKDRSEVSGTGKKPHPQKGTGRARAGTRRAPHHRGGGVAHGPKPRSHEHSLQRKVRRLGLCCALSAKLAEGNLIIIDAAAPAAPKTAALLGQLQALCAARGEPVVDEPSFLIVDGEAEAQAEAGVMLRRAAGNLPRVHPMPSVGLNVYTVVKNRTLVLTTAALAEVTERLTRPIKR